MSALMFGAAAVCPLALVVAALAIRMAGMHINALQLAAERLAKAKRDAAYERDRAEAAEKALTEIQMKRSLAVSKGNRTRAELERARILETTEAVRVAVQRKKQPQGSLPL